MFDNEIYSEGKKPIGAFLNHAKIFGEKRVLLEKKYIIDNLYLLTVPLIGGKPECDIEDLFENVTLSHKIDGKEFTKKDHYEVSKYYGKDMFSKYILNNYSDINFNKFKSVLDNINRIIDTHTKGLVDKVHEFEAKNIGKSNEDKVPLEV